jgi:hypothetical protein
VTKWWDVVPVGAQLTARDADTVTFTHDGDIYIVDLWSDDVVRVAQTNFSTEVVITSHP